MKKHKGLIISLIILVMVYAFFCIYTRYSKILEVSSMMEHNLYYTKNINIDELQKHINTAQKALGVVEDLTTKGASNLGNAFKGPLTSRPLNKFFED